MLQPIQIDPRTGLPIVPRPAQPFLSPELMSPTPMAQQPGQLGGAPAPQSAPGPLAGGMEPRPFGPLTQQPPTAPEQPSPIAAMLQQQAMAAPEGQSQGGGGMGGFFGSDAALGLAAGILEGGTDGQALGRGFRYAMQSRAGERGEKKALAAQEAKERKAQESLNRTADYFRKMGRDDLAEQVLVGGANDAFKALNKGTEGPDPATITNITTMRKEAESQPGTSRYRTSVPILSSMAGAINDQSAMSDLDFVYGMAKIFDPTSVVRESEMGLVIQGQSVPAGLIGMVQKMTAGGAAIGPQARKQLVDASMRRVNEYRVQAEGEQSAYGGIAKRHKIDTQDIIRPLEPLPPLPPEPPSPSEPDKEGDTASGPGGKKLIFKNGKWGPL